MSLFIYFLIAQKLMATSQVDHDHMMRRCKQLAKELHHVSKSVAPAFSNNPSTKVAPALMPVGPPPSHTRRQVATTQARLPVAHVQSPMTGTVVVEDTARKNSLWDMSEDQIQIAAGESIKIRV